MANKLDLDHIERKTGRNIERKADAIKYAFNLLEDPKHKERKEACMCPICFYGGPFIAGRAMSEKECDYCKKNMVFSSTHTHHFCLDCAKKHHLCADCGGQMDLQLGRLKQLEGK